MPAYLAKFALVDRPGIGPCWCPPDGVRALIDLSPPGQESDPEVNFAIMLSDKPLDSNVVHFDLGTGDVRELSLSTAGRAAWLKVTGVDPGDGTVADAITRHLTTFSDPFGQDVARPLMGLNQEIWLGERIYSQKLPSLSDPAAAHVWAGTLESIRTIVRGNASDAELAKYYGGLEIANKLAFGSLKTLLPNDALLPKLDSVKPRTVKTETWPNVGGPHDNEWTAVAWNQIGGTPAVWSVANAGRITADSNAGLFRLDYVFGGNDRDGSYVAGNTSSGSGITLRSDANAGNSYDLFGFNGNQVFEKCVSNAPTTLNSTTRVDGDTFRGTIIGSTWTHYKNAVSVGTGTDTAIATGTRSGCLAYIINSTGTIRSVSFDDTLAASGMAMALNRPTLGVG